MPKSFPTTDCTVFATPEMPPLDTAAAAKEVGLSPRTLVKMRCYGGGPVFEKNGRRVLYDIADLRAWRRGNKRCSTAGFAGGR